MFFYTINLSCLKRNQARCHHVANPRESKHVRNENLYLQIQVEFPGTRNDIVGNSAKPSSTKNFFSTARVSFTRIRDRDTIETRVSGQKPEIQRQNRKERERDENDREQVGTKIPNIFSWKTKSPFPRPFRDRAQVLIARTLYLNGGRAKKEL